ncbi:SP_1767 family glycosyltransferase [Amedibacillus sp. YH-ame10]
MKNLIKAIYHSLIRIRYYYVSYFLRNLEISTIENTLDYIISEKKSVSRFGDGEFKWMECIHQESFQTYSKSLSERLKEVIYTDSDKLIICLPDAFRIDFSEMKKKSSEFWILELSKYGKKYLKYLDKNKKYFNANMTRFYIDYKDYQLSRERFKLIKMLWDNRDVLIIEGEKTRLGIGNDLFDNSKNISRILVPAEDAYSVYDKILEKTLEFSTTNTLILLAIGPTATVLAYDLSNKQRQAIDIGHIDIEYEWFLIKATDKIPVKNKYTNEAKIYGGTNIKNCNSKKYQNEIVTRIKRMENSDE